MCYYFNLEVSASTPKLTIFRDVAPPPCPVPRNSLLNEMTNVTLYSAGAETTTAGLALETRTIGETRRQTWGTIFPR